MYKIMYYGGMGLAIVMFIASILLFIKLRIYKVVGDITGITAKKAIKEIRENNLKSGVKTYKTSRINSERGKVTERIQSLQQIAVSENDMDPKEITEELTSEETTLLQNPGGQETTLLQNPEVEGYSNETTVLSEQQVENYFNLEVDIMIVNTYESI